MRRLGLFVLAACSVGWSQDGAVVFQRQCITCHRFGSGTRAPHRVALSLMSRQAIIAALETGSMRTQGAALSAAERVAVAEFLAGPDASTMAPLTGFCSDKSAPFSEVPGWNGWGVDLANSRFQPASVAGFDRRQVARLKLKWAFGFRGVASAVAQPTVAGGRVFVGSADGTVYSLDARTGCIYWTYQAAAMVRAAMVVGPGNRVGYFGDLKANVYAIELAKGEVRWKTQVDQHPAARITGAPKLHAGRLYVPVSSFEELAGEDPGYECCTFRGSVVALDVENGRQLWKTYTIPEEPKPTHRNSKGTQLWGPSGGAVWSSPTLDPERQALYVGTGNSYTDPPAQTTDAILALDIDSGKLLWSRQITPDDRWTLACVNPDKASCPENPGPDFDIGTSPILCRLSATRSLLVVGQKSGIVHALDPDRQGKIVWQTRIGRGGIMGGIEWGGAADAENAYVPLSDWDEVRPEVGGGLFALRLSTGKQVWYAPPPPPACVEQAGCSAAQSAPATLIPGAVFSGSMDGYLRAYDTRNGKLIWQFDTRREFPTVNGVKARGGSLNATGPTVADKMLYVSSGYGMVAGMPGNVLLVFSIDSR